MLQMFIIMNSLEYGLARVALSSCNIEIFEMFISILEYEAREALLREIDIFLVPYKLTLL